jgi:protein-tyrosine kinase
VITQLHNPLIQPHDSVVPETALPAAPFRHLLRQILAGLGSGEASHVARLGVTACRPKEGASTVATQLAWAAAVAQRDEALLIDCNPLSRDANPGLADLVHAGGELEQFVQPTPVRRLWSMSVGSLQLRRTLFDRSELLGETLDRLAQGYQPIICDLPPVSEATGMLGLACQLDGVLLVVEAGRTPQEQVVAAQRMLLRRQVRLLGVVLNKHRSSLEHGWSG